MEDMRAVAVYEDPLLLRAVDIAGNVIPFVDDQALFPVLYRFVVRVSGTPGVPAGPDTRLVIRPLRGVMLPPAPRRTRSAARRE